jgi:RNA recognition motif-containing protein
MEGVDSKKLFVGGISQITDEVSLEAYFRKFGNVLEVEIKRDHEEARQDPSSKRHRGFGFVTFESSDSAVSVLTHPIPHLLDDKKVSFFGEYTEYRLHAHV